MKKRSVRRTVTTGRGRWGAIIALGCAIALTAALLAQPRPSARNTTGKRDASRKNSAGQTEVKAAQRKPLSYYTAGVRADIFGSPPAAPTPVITPSLPTTPPAPVEPAVIDPFVDYAYTGTIVMGGQPMALVENSKTKEGTYLKVGDQLLGGTVTEVTERGVTLTIAGRPRTLSKTEDFSLTPLDKDAAYLTQQPQQGQFGPGAGRPGGTPGMPGMSGAPGGFPGMPADFQSRMQQRFQGMSPEQMQDMRNRWMNRSFERGGERRRRFF